MLTWLTTFGKTHLTYIVIILIGLIAFRSWLAEHDARQAADAVVKTEQTQIAGLQQQIVAVNAAADQKVQIVTKVIHDAKTPAQVVAVVPQLTEVPLNTRVAPDNPAQVSVDALPFLGLLGQAKEDAINLKACQDTTVLKDQQLQAKDIEIAALKKKPNFWHRMLGTAKAVGVGIGIGAVIGAKL